MIQGPKHMFWYLGALLCLTLLMFGSTACVSRAQVSLPPYPNGYLQDEVATVQILMDPDSVSLMFEDVEYGASHLWPATFIYTSSALTDTLENVGFRLRGNTSLFAAKKSFKVDFNEFVEGQKFQGVEKFNLNGESNDPSLLRSALSWRVLRDWNLAGARTAHVRLYLNDEYRGLYLNTEHFDEEWTDAYFDNGQGNLYKCTFPADLHYISDNPDEYKFEVWGRRAYELKTNNDLDDYTDLAEFIDVLNNSTDDYTCEMRDVFNVPDYLKYLAFDVLIANWDAYSYNKNNYYLYHNQKTGLMEYIAYDLDNTWGIDWLDQNWTVRDPYNWPSEYRPLVERLLETPEFRKWYTFYLHQAMETWFSGEQVQAFFDAKQPLMQDALAADTYYPQAFGFDLDDFLTSDNSASGGHVEYGLVDWVANRLIGMETYLEDQTGVLILNHLRDGGFDPDSLRFKITAESNAGIPEVWLWLDDGSGEFSYPMYDDGQHDDRLAGDGLYGVVLPIQPEWGALAYRVQSTAGSLERWYPCSPRPLGYNVVENPEVVLNELMASNTTAHLDEAGEADDWCELYNTGATAVQLSSYALSDDPSNPGKWPLPELVINPGDWVLFWLDQDLDQGALHANFQLDADGEELGLYRFDEAWEQVDHITFASLLTDRSFGRETDGTPNWVDFSTTTPDASNAGGVVGIPSGSVTREVWPNPTHGQLWLDAPSDGEILDAHGKLLRTFQGASTISLADLPDGVYLIRTGAQVYRVLKRG